MEWFYYFLGFTALVLTFYIVLHPAHRRGTEAPRSPLRSAARLVSGGFGILLLWGVFAGVAMSPDFGFFGWPLALGSAWGSAVFLYFAITGKAPKALIF